VKTETKSINFEGCIVRCVYDTEQYKAYAIDVDKEKYPFVKNTKYGNAIVSGNLHSLGEGINYKVEAVEELTKNGYGYKVVNIKRDRPNSLLDMQKFLAEILTPIQAKVLYDAYPDIVDRVVNNNLDDVDLSKTKGIKEYTFNIIKEKIVENFCLVELISEFQGLLSLNMVKKLYEKYASIEKIRIEMKNNPYKCLCGISRVGFKTADNLLLEMDRVSKENVTNGKKQIIDFGDDLKTSGQRCLACVLYLLEENENNGHTKMNIIDLKNQTDKLVPSCSNHFIEVVKDDSIYYNKTSRDIALKSTYETELYIAENISYGLQLKRVWNINHKQYQNSGDYPLTDEQVGALKNVNEFVISILNGSGGTGKSATTATLIQMLEDNNKSYKLFSPTGKAAKVLKDYCKRPTSTIHRGLGYIPPDEWTFNKDCKMGCDVLIIDEFSMTDIFLFKHVIDAIDFNTTKLVLVGDNAQLPSVSCGNLLHDFMQSKIIPTTTLTKVFRYGEGGLMKVATDVRECKIFIDKENMQQCTYYGENKDYAFINVSSDNMVKNVLALYQKLITQGNKPEDILVLSAFNKGEFGTVVLNNYLQKLANPNYEKTTPMKFGETTYYKGDLVIQKQNNYKARLYINDNFEFGCDDASMETFIANGETGVIVDINFNTMIIDFDGIKVEYTRDNLQTIGLGYSISTHKSQGGNAKIIILLTPKAHTIMLNSNIIYVGLTRMRERCFHFGDVDTVNKAVKKKENFNRLTFMKELLNNNKKY
jgi:exodeoxyribonuclease V alpha subunit